MAKASTPNRRKADRRRVERRSAKRGVTVRIEDTGPSKRQRRYEAPK